ncbi:hypothetical protein QYF36_027004 [Acer negundo]|nr:hypothetical protein QYF36_027004 [Acer negundo]
MFLLSCLNDWGVGGGVCGTRKDALYKHRVNLFLTSSHTPPHTIHDTLLLQSLILLFFSYLSRKLAV